MLVYLTKMGQTLVEAARYLRTAQQNDLRAELMENGRQMLAQIENSLEQHRGDLRSDAPLTQLTEIKALWEREDETLEGRLGQFTRELPNEVSYQVRAVFFAELGEKWDAMASVYEYMRDDPRFDPVVVRTPVGRVVKHNGKQKQDIIYKDFLTPMGIPSLGYDQYDIEKDCPELAFISQPYESCTLEQFWPESIAKHTRLVYLPYYLPDLINDSNVFTLAQLPVFKFAWKVPCPTEKQRRFYCRHAANSGSNLVMTGIPKTDPYVALRTHPIPYPKHRGRLEGKTVFLWNSWYDVKFSSLHFFNEILEWFNAHRDCALIWRCHPMTDTVTKLYYPDQYPAYQKNLKKAKSAPNVILDTETFCGAAFSASQAMISDYSSLIPQYLLVDKPTLWVRNQHKYNFIDQFIDNSWVEQAFNAEGIFDFMERVCMGEDRNAPLRRKIRERDIPLADGRCGERLCNELWDSLLAENEIGGRL